MWFDTFLQLSEIGVLPPHLANSGQRFALLLPRFADLSRQNASNIPAPPRFFAMLHGLIGQLTRRIATIDERPNQPLERLLIDWSRASVSVIRACHWACEVNSNNYWNDQVGLYPEGIRFKKDRQMSRCMYDSACSPKHSS